MRISTPQIFNAGLRSMQTAQSGVARTQAELAAGKRILTPADDPPGAALALRIDQDIARSEQFTRNIDVAESDLHLEESQLDAVGNVLYRLRELVIQAGDGALSFAERNSIVAELDARREELQGIFNTQMANGEYLFSGFQGSTPAFVQSPAGRVEFQGDTGQRFLQVASAVDVEVRDNGKGLFVDIASANQTFLSSPGLANTGSGDINVGRIVDQAAWDAVFPDDLLITFDDPLGPGSFTINQRDRGTGALTPLATQVYADGQPITVAGVEVVIQGAPVNGDEFVIAASNTQSLITTIQRMVLALRRSPDTPAGEITRAQGVAETLSNLSQAETHVFGAQARLGSRLNLLDTVREEQAQLKLVNQELHSDITDVDFNEAVSRLNFQSFALEAAQKSFARVAGLSLFNFLR